MKLTVLQENLTKAVTQASRFTSTRSQLPILGNILLKTKKTKLDISSTNLEISVSSQIGAKVEEEGEISIPSKVFSELISNLPSGQISLESNKEQVKIETSGFSSNVLGMDSTDFPKIPSSIENAISFPKKEILDSLSRVIFATSVDETRPILTGVLFIFDKNSLTLVATDGFRLSRRIIDLKNDLDAKNRIVIPKNILNEVLRSQESSDQILFEVQDKEKQVLIGLGDVVLTSRFLEGDYPDFEKIIPKNSLVTVRLNKDDFARAVKLASVFARDAANVVKLKLSSDSIFVLAESSSSGSQETKVEAKVEGDIGQDWQISFNYRFLEDFLHSAVGEEVKMEFTTTDKAGVFTDTSDPNYLHLIMSIKVQG